MDTETILQHGLELAGEAGKFLVEHPWLTAGIQGMLLVFIAGGSGWLIGESIGKTATNRHGLNGKQNTQEAERLGGVVGAGLGIFAVAMGGILLASS
ncbi:hypothetical protein KBD69_02070 [Candidatus Woesebacteria bacterium]|nr:hypothetical protein [Candidatus Woesebacteria bacterium]